MGAVEFFSADRFAVQPTGSVSGGQPALSALAWLRTFPASGEVFFRMS